MNKRVALVACVVLCGVATVAAAVEVNDSGIKTHWSYVGSSGPQHWGMLSPAFELCDTGKAQSPVNLGRNRTRVPYQLKINYHDAPLVLGESLTTNITLSQTPMLIDTGHSLQVNFHPKSDKEIISYAGHDYDLIQFHFHSPSETEWHKQAFPLEIHFVHQGKDGRIAVLSVLVKGGEENAELAKIIEHIPNESGHEAKINGVNVDPAQLLPADKRYFSYEGSLTTPPCSEGVQWIVLSKPITASPAQILKIREASHGANARPVQPLNNRILSYAVES